MRFSCGRCDRGLETEGARVNHQRTCTGRGRGVVGGRRDCGNCRSWITVGNYARHVRCLGRRGWVGVRGRVRQCNLCWRVVSAANFARHQDECRVWDPGRGPMPWQGRAVVDGWTTGGSKWGEAPWREWRLGRKESKSTWSGDKLLIDNSNDWNCSHFMRISVWKSIFLQLQKKYNGSYLAPNITRIFTNFSLLRYSFYVVGGVDNFKWQNLC